MIAYCLKQDGTEKFINVDRYGKISLVENIEDVSYVLATKNIAQEAIDLLIDQGKINANNPIRCKKIELFLFECNDDDDD